jgi:hypothetical protein
METFGRHPRAVLPGATMIRSLAVLLTSACLLSFSGCAVNRATATADPSLRWDSIKSLHVKQLEGEDGSTKKLIAEKLRASGFMVSADPEPNVQADAVVTYVDRWMWDMTMYMLELTVVVREPKSDFPLATGNSFHTSLTRKSPKEMVDEVIDNILKQRK